MQLCNWNIILCIYKYKLIAIDDSDVNYVLSTYMVFFPHNLLNSNNTCGYTLIIPLFLKWIKFLVGLFPAFDLILFFLKNKMLMDWKNWYCKMSILPKAKYRFNVILIKILMAFFTGMKQIILECLWNHRRP